MTFQELQESAYKLTEREIRKISRQLADEYFAALKVMDNRLRTLYSEILAGIPKEEYYNYMTKFKRLERLTQAFQAEYLKVSKAAGRLIPASQELALSNMFYRSQYSINWPLDLNTVFTPLNPKIIEASVYGTSPAWGRLQEIYGDIKDFTPKSGTLLRELLTKRNSQVLLNIEQILRQSMIQGEGFRKTSRELRNLLQTDANSALKIIRTESQRNMNIGNYSATQAARAQGVDIQRQILSTLDARTRSQSVAVDKQLENEEGYFVYPGGVLVRTPGNSGIARYDINDRERIINIVDEKSPQLRRARDPIDGETKIISFKSYPEWAKDNGLKKNIYGKYIHSI